MPLRQPAWSELPGALRGSIFLLSLVFAASMMPVHRLPDASWQVALGLGFVSAVFDNIPLTALALKQGGYDWGFVAYAVGFGGSMIWFGSSAGVALSNMFPEGKNAIAWVKGGWHVAVAYVDRLHGDARGARLGTRIRSTSTSARAACDACLAPAAAGLPAARAIPAVS